MSTSASASAASSSTSTPPTTSRQRHRGVFLIERVLENILIAPDNSMPPSLGRHADDYLYRHGWDVSSRCFIAKVYHEQPMKKNFVKKLMAHGAAGAEMEYLHDLISQANREPF